MKTRRQPSNSQPIKSLDELKPFLWIARYYNPHNVNNRREQIRAIVDERYVIQTQSGNYEVVDRYFYALLIDRKCLFKGKGGEHC